MTANTSVEAAVILNRRPASVSRRYQAVFFDKFAGICNCNNIYLVQRRKTLVDGIRKYNAPSIAVNPTTDAKPTALPNVRESIRNTTADKTAQSSLTSR